MHLDLGKHAMGSHKKFKLYEPNQYFNVIKMFSYMHLEWNKDDILEIYHNSEQ